MSTAPPQTRPRRPSKLAAARRELYRAAILDAAEEVFAREGYDAARVQDLAREADLSLTTLYGVFPGKWEIFCAVQERRLGELMAQTLGAGELPKDPFARLRLGLESYLRFHMAHPTFLRLELREQVPWGTTDELRTPIQTRTWRAGLSLMTQAFQAGMDQGLFVPDDPELCARTATAMSQVRLALWARAEPRAEPDRVVAEALAQLVRAFATEARAGELLAALAADLPLSACP